MGWISIFYQNQTQTHNMHLKSPLSSITIHIHKNHKIVQSTKTHTHIVVVDHQYKNDTIKYHKGKLVFSHQSHIQQQTEMITWQNRKLQFLSPFIYFTYVTSGLGSISTILTLSMSKSLKQTKNLSSHFYSFRLAVNSIHKSFHPSASGNAPPNLSSNFMSPRKIMFRLDFINSTVSSTSLTRSLLHIWSHFCGPGHRLLR